MRITGPIPERIRRLMPREERTTRETMTLDDVSEEQSAKSEKELQRQIADWLRMKGVPVGNPRMDRKSTLALGFPDFVFPWLPAGGRFVALEVKTDSGKQTDDQKRFEAMIHANGGLYYLVRSLAEVVECLSEVNRSPHRWQCPNCKLLYAVPHPTPGAECCGFALVEIEPIAEVQNG